TRPAAGAPTDITLRAGLDINSAPTVAARKRFARLASARIAPPLPYCTNQGCRCRCAPVVRNAPISPNIATTIMRLRRPLRPTHLLVEETVGGRPATSTTPWPRTVANGRRYTAEEKV